MNEDKPEFDADDLEPEYDLDYSKAKPNHFAARLKKKTIVLDEDVAKVFDISVQNPTEP